MADNEQPPADVRPDNEQPPADVRPDNEQPPADVRPAARNIARPPPPPRRNQFSLVLVLVFGVLLGQFYLSYIVPRYSVLPTTYTPASFQNKSANYYDVLNISQAANASEIKLAYETQISNLNPVETSASRSTFDFTAHAKMIEVAKAYSILQGGE
ncbi:hypothetical protein F4859DRAFT_509601 [Xylaria cf. heliscus]|nr:hypothetical protein F4859DRAFT_509601 [Xylaria cf. heliscus]